MEQARTEAYAHVVERVCHGLSDARCDGIRRSIRPWEDGLYNRKTRTACAAAVFPQEKLVELEREAAELDRGIARMANAVARQIEEADTALLHHEPPIWTGGCAAGLAGDHLRNTVNGKLGHRGVRLDRDGRADAQVARLQLELAPASAAGVQITGYLELPKAEGWSSIAGPSFALDLLGLDEVDRVECRGDDALGLRRGHRIGQGGLQIWVDLPNGQNLFCQGDVITPTIRVSEPARVQVYSVLRDGTAYLVWPFEGDGIIETQLALDPAMLSANPDGSDESLVALALPTDAPFGPTQGWRAYCKASDDFNHAYYPPGAAADTAVFTVRSQGRSCPATEINDNQTTVPDVAACGW